MREGRTTDGGPEYVGIRYWEKIFAFCRYTRKFSLRNLGPGVLWRCKSEQSAKVFSAKSYFHQFAKVFSLESFPLYGIWLFPVGVVMCDRAARRGLLNAQRDRIFRPLCNFTLTRKAKKMSNSANIVLVNPVMVALRKRSTSVRFMWV